MTSHSPSCTTRDANVESSPVRNPRTDSSSFNSRDSPPSFDLVDVSSVMKSWSYQPRSSQHAQIHTVLFSNNHASISASKPKSSAPESTDACILIANKTTLQPQEIKRRPTASADHSGFFISKKNFPNATWWHYDWHQFWLFAISLFGSLWIWTIIRSTSSPRLWWPDSGWFQKLNSGNLDDAATSCHCIHCPATQIVRGPQRQNIGPRMAQVDWKTIGKTRRAFQLVIAR